MKENGAEFIINPIYGEHSEIKTCPYAAMFGGKS